MIIISNLICIISDDHCIFNYKVQFSNGDTIKYLHALNVHISIL